MSKHFNKVTEDDIRELAYNFYTNVYSYTQTIEQIRDLSYSEYRFYKLYYKVMNEYWKLKTSTK